MADHWAPDEPPEPLPGRAAIVWGRIALVALVATTLCVAATPFIFVVVPTSLKPLTLGGLLLVLVGFGSIGLYATVRGYRRAHAERDRGYTTTYSDHRYLWQLDPKSGEVVRKPGEKQRRPRPW